MEKSASTARTFGLEMEEVVGHITSIGSVTMESGERIGNALKTIYARITTNDKAIDALEAVEVSINKISETGEVVVRDTGDILDELASKWSGLTDAQRQTTAVGIAGVNQLSRLTDITYRNKRVEFRKTIEIGNREPNPELGRCRDYNTHLNK